jgi:transcriptional regulator with XRE-family HTH domain
LLYDSLLAIIGIMPKSAGDLLRQARLRAGLNQRQLATMANTTQSVVARIETGQTSPGWDTIARLVEAAGFVLDAALAEAPDFGNALADSPRIMSLTPAARLHELRNVDRFFQAIRRVQPA